jgi:hypothetical protein
MITLLSGCGGSSAPTARLRGVVTIGGKPIPADADAIIMFRTTGADQARPVSARITNGQFDVPNAPRGSVLVKFSIRQPTGMAAFQPGADVEMQSKPIVPKEWEAGKTYQIDGDDLEMKFDL